MGGQVTLALAPGALGELARGHPVAMVSGTNGKTTTTRLLSTALRRRSEVVTNAGGANLPTGLVTALWGAPKEAHAVLEVDESWVPTALAETQPRCLVLLNLSRDQLDRVSEVRMIASRWRAALVSAPGTSVVANADDPIVAWAALASQNPVWVAAGQPWRADAIGCPQCEGRLHYEDQDWRCLERCGFARPSPRALVDPKGRVLMPDGTLHDVVLRLPGRFNQANAAMAAVAAAELGVSADESFDAMSAVEAVEGRYEVLRVAAAGSEVLGRLLLAKNPAGWSELLDVVAASEGPLVIGINAKVADGRDTSWLWDVPFERLAGRLVFATGERWRDLAVRLHYAGVEHVVEPDMLEALLDAGKRQAGPRRGGPAGVVDVVANYTAFQTMRKALSSHGSRPVSWKSSDVAAGAVDAERARSATAVSMPTRPGSSE